MEHTILLVDDARLFLEIQKDFLKNSPVQVVTARDGREALCAISLKRPDLVFMDLEMPEMNGAECCRAIKSDPALTSIPVVMITAKGDRESQEACRRASCDDFLTKPLDRNLFLETAGRFVPRIERREPRKKVKLSGTIDFGCSSFPCRIANLSATGAFLETDFPGKTWRLIRLTVLFPDGSLFECQGTIIWIQPPGHGTLAGLGVNFTIISTEHKKMLERYLQGVASPPFRVVPPTGSGSEPR